MSITLSETIKRVPQGLWIMREKSTVASPALKTLSNSVLVESENSTTQEYRLHITRHSCQSRPVPGIAFAQKPGNELSRGNPEAYK